MSAADAPGSAPPPPADPPTLVDNSDIDWDVVVPPPVSAFDRVQTRASSIARPGSPWRWVLLFVGVLGGLVGLAVVLQSPDPLAEGDLLAALAQSSQEFAPAFVTTTPRQAEEYVADVFGWPIRLPALPGLMLVGVGEAELTPEIALPAVRYDGPDDEWAVVFAYDYAFLDLMRGALDLPEAAYAQLAEPVPVDPRRLEGVYLVTWRERAVLYTAVTASEAAFERIGRKVRDAAADAPAP